jgi:pimeloyl-[acyl-carrier protein] methyl ester esterase
MCLVSQGISGSPPSSTVRLRLVDDTGGAGIFAPSAMPSLAAESGTLHHEDAGTGAPVVLVHGWSLSSAVFADELAQLARERRAIAPDLRGHGRSSAPARPFGLADLARDLAALFEALRLERAVLLGWSLGAQVALAAAPLVRPRLAGLVLVAGTPRFTEAEGWPNGLPARAVEGLAARVRRDAPRAVARFFEGMFAEGELDEAGRARAEAARVAVPPADPAALLCGLDVLAREDLRPALPALDLPVLLVHGERDAVCPPAASRALAAAIPGARLAIVPGAGHAPFLSRPGPFRDALRPFLGEHR